MKVHATIDGAAVSFEVSPGETLLELLRREGYHGVKLGCGEGDCGACTVLLDGQPVSSCLVLAARVEGREVTTIEGLGSIADPHPLQLAFAAEGAVQCGYCTPGTILSAAALLRQTPDPSESEIAEALDGNLCRCTGYVKTVRAVEAAARCLREGDDGR